MAGGYRHPDQQNASHSTVLTDALNVVVSDTALQRYSDDDVGQILWRFVDMH